MNAPARDHDAAHPLVALAAATLSVAVSALPIFLLGALAVFVRDDLRFSESALGLVASAYYLTSALSSTPGGRFTERLGARRAIAVAAAITLFSLLGVALLARSWGTLVPFMMIAGVANGIALPASNLLLARAVPAERQGMAFGLKQSSGPVATVIAGAAVPLVGLTIGWRWAFVLVALIAAPLLLFAGSQARSSLHPPVREEPQARRPLIILGVGAAAAVIGGSSLGAFYVESAVASGTSAGTAGTLLAVGAVTGIASRIGWGWLAGRSRRIHIPLLGGLLIVGSIGYLLLAAVGTDIGLAVTTILVFLTGWGWPPLFLYAIVVRSEPAPAAATGLAGTGLYAGGIVGPLAFGILVEQSGYEAAWAFVAISSVIAGLLFLHGGRTLEREAARMAAPRPSTTAAEPRS